MPTPQLRSLSLEWLKVETSLVLFFAMKYWCPEYGSWLRHLPGGEPQATTSPPCASVLSSKRKHMRTSL